MCSLGRRIERKPRPAGTLHQYAPKSISMQTLFLTILSALLLSIPQAAHAQDTSDSAAPDVKALAKPVSQFVSTTTPLTASQQDQLDAFTKAVASQMGSSDTSEVMEARNRCNELLDSFYSYMQSLRPVRLNVKFVFLTEQISFLPDNILNSTQKCIPYTHEMVKHNSLYLLVLSNHLNQ